LKEPKPFVHATALGDFAVTYQINAHCDEPTRMHGCTATCIGAS
jgi:hypothetical protein